MVKDKKLENLTEIHGVEEIETPHIKIEKIEDYYNLFVSMLKTEDEMFYQKEHAWILGINEKGYTTCCYLIGLGSENFISISASILFRVSLFYNCTKIVLAHHHCDYKPIINSAEDLSFTSKVYHQAKLLGIELFDHIILSLESLESKNPVYLSYKNHNMLDIIANDTYYKTYGEMENIVKQELKATIKQEKMTIAKKLLLKNIDIQIIIETTGLSKKKIEKIQKDIDRYK